MPPIRQCACGVAVLAACLGVAACDLFTDPEPPPAAPSTLAAAPTSNTAMELTWAVAAGKVETYRIERALSTEGLLPLLSLPDTVRAFRDSGLAPATQYSYQVLACNETGCSPPSPLATASTFATLVLVTDALPAAVEGRPFEGGVAAEGGAPPYAFDVAAGVLPPGLALAPDGALSGTPTAPGDFAFTVRAQSSDAQSATRALAVEVIQRLEITTLTLPDASRGGPYSTTVRSIGGRPPLAWTLAAGALPAGLSLSAGGVISGRPTVEESATFTLQVGGAAGQVQVRSYTIRVTGGPPPEPTSVASVALPPALLGAPYAPLLAANGGSGSYAWSLIGGALPPGVSLGADGQISGAPAATGSFTVTALVTSGGTSDQATFAFEVVADRPDRYDITRMDVAGVPASLEAHVAAAIARWEEALTGDLAAGHIPSTFFSSIHCGGFGKAVNGASFDDIIVIVNVAPIDGPGAVLGRAGPCAWREGSLLPVAGALTLDSDDLAPLAGTETLTSIVFHEIGHILGVGSLWEAFGFVGGGGGADPRFTGTNAAAEFQALGGIGDVPLETEGGEGTAESHWRESVFDNEVMTGFSERVGVEQPLSRMTLAALADLGYAVDMDAADAYALPGGGGAPVAGAMRGDLGRDIVGVGPVLVLDDLPLTPPRERRR